MNRESVSTRYESPIKGEGPVEMVNTQEVSDVQKMTVTYMGQEQTISADRFGRFTDSMRFKIAGTDSLTEKAVIKMFDGEKLVGESTAKMQTLMNGGSNYTGNPVQYKTARELKYHISTPKEQDLPLFNDEKITGSCGVIAQFEPEEAWADNLGTKFPKKKFPWVPAALCCVGTTAVSGGTYYYCMMP